MTRKLKMVNVELADEVKPGDQVIIGIDASLSGTGLVVLVNGRLLITLGWTSVVKHHRANSEALTFFKTKDSSLISRTHRIAVIEKWFVSSLLAITQMLRKVDSSLVPFAAMEDYAMSQHSNRATDLHELGGTLKGALWITGIPFRLYDPGSLKLSLVGKGKADKPQMTMTASRRAGVEFYAFGPPGEDMADAFAAALLLHQELGVKAGELTLAALPEKVRAVLLRTTKARPTAFISQELIQATGDLPGPLLTLPDWQDDNTRRRLKRKRSR
jgi:Holliday junction resolvasome RuvABC endonuclease subunit